MRQRDVPDERPMTRLEAILVAADVRNGRAARTVEEVVRAEGVLGWPIRPVSGGAA